MNKLTTNNNNPGQISRNPPEQAAILLLSLGIDAAAKVMSKMNRTEVVLLSEAMARLHGVKLMHAREALNDFFSDYREQSGINGASREYLRGILEKSLGGEIARTVINGIYGDEIRQRMTSLQWVDPPQLSALIAQEHAQLQAIFLAFLPPEVAATVLSQLPAEQQDKILYRITCLDDINPQVIEELDRLIARGIALLSEQGSKVIGIKCAADIMNRIPANRQALLDLLQQRDSGVVDQLKDQMYEFYILSQQTPTTLQLLLEEIPLEDWAIALKGSETLLRQAIFGSIPKRQISTLQAAIARLGPVPISRIEHARKEIMSRVRQLAEEGAIQVQLFSEQTLE